MTWLHITIGAVAGLVAGWWVRELEQRLLDGRWLIEISTNDRPNVDVPDLEVGNRSWN